jgi:hypothetical protein
MTQRRMPRPLRDSQRILRLVLLVLLVGGSTACGRRGAGAPDAGPGAAGSGGESAGADAAAGTQGNAADAAPDGAGLDADPGRVSMRRLTKLEYDNTVKDLLGVTSTPAARLGVDEPVAGFDNLADGLHMSPDRYLQYFEAAATLADAVWDDVALKNRIVTCAPDTTGKCARDVIRAFGLRAWRRPLADDEVDSLGKFADAALGETADFSIAMKRVVTVMLSSLPFLYKIEIDPQPDTTAPHALTGYELASRLSYLLWSSMPDAELFGLGDGLRAPDVLSAQLDRMLDSPRSDAFVESFAGQWLGARELVAHGVSRGPFPEWDQALQEAMTKEMHLYFVDFFDRPMSEFLTADVHFANARLGAHYGISPPVPGPDFVRVKEPMWKTGFLGLAGFLTLTSREDRTSPSRRGSWILEHLLCAPPGGHPPEINPRLDIGSAAVNLRTVLNQTLLQASCKTCHATFDGVGFALENFDAIGRFRSNYTPTEPIDASGMLGGVTFTGAIELAAALAADPRVATCAARKALSYSLGRALTAEDDARVTALVGSWKQGTVRQLLHAIVASDAFRFRRGELP